ncbi:hypothetical protein [Oceanobacillus jeddahense]|uniref:hypothetical protein n=1 Tax=Oceanobacillus jeddahense TaxID=1462527 RepID=UPI001652AD60|nr:hypothetical protein [Oceanobacillus jeddahense]
MMCWLPRSSVIKTYSGKYRCSIDKAVKEELQLREKEFAAPKQKMQLNTISSLDFLKIND